MTLQIWDTAGQERYKAICSAHYKRARGVLLIYDITKRQTFDELEEWIFELKQRCQPNCKIILIGNKKDEADKDPNMRQVSEEEGHFLANRNQDL